MQDKIQTKCMKTETYVKIHMFKALSIIIISIRHLQCRTIDAEKIKVNKTGACCSAGVGPAERAPAITGAEQFIRRRWRRRER